MVSRLIILFFFITQVYSKVIPINSYCDNNYLTQLDNLSESDLYLSDLDETLILAQLPLATSSFFNYKYKQNKNAAINIFNTVQNLTTTCIAEQSIANHLQRLSSRNVRTYYVTARSINTYDATIRQLKKHKIELASDSNQYFIVLLNDRPVVFINGILFCNGQNKSRCLDILFSKLLFNPTNIVYVDDSKKHIDDIHNYFLNKDIMCTCFHYISNTTPSYNNEQCQRFDKLYNKFVSEIINISSDLK